MEFIRWQQQTATPNTCALGVTLYGSHKKRDKMKIYFRTPLPQGGLTSQDAQRQYLIRIVNEVQREVKYSAAWKCFHCGEPAHEIIHSPMSWLHKPEPFILDSAHAVCRQGGRCRKEIEAHNAELAEEFGLPWQNALAPPNDLPSREPLAASCSVCHKEGKLSVCSGCSVIRYCGRKCQTEDFKRHKKICKWIGKVEKEFAPDD